MMKVKIICILIHNKEFTARWYFQFVGFINSYDMLQCIKFQVLYQNAKSSSCHLRVQ